MAARLDTFGKPFWEFIKPLGRKSEKHLTHLQC